MTAYYFYQCLLCWASCIMSSSPTTVTTYSIERIDSAGCSSNQITHSLHQRAYENTQIPPDRLPLKRDCQSGFSRTKQINTTVMNLPTITTNAEWHDFHDRKRAQLMWRLEQAQRTEWNWPSTRARVEVDRIEREIERVNEDEFIVPNFDTDHFRSCASEGARL